MNVQNLIQVNLIRPTTIPVVTLSSRRHVFQVVATVLFALAAPLAAHASPEASDIGSGRLVPAAAGVVGLIGIVVGRRALARSRHTGTARSGAIVAAVLGLTSLVVGGLHVANSAGGFGTGNGRAGAIVAMAIGLIGIVLGGLALARSRRIASGSTMSGTASHKKKT